MKSLAVSGLRSRFDGQEDIKKCSAEVPVDVSDTKGRQQARRADALLEFATPNRFFGDGVIVEVQHANESKNIPQVTADYLSANYSVLWADENWFANEEFLIDNFDPAFENDNGVAFTPYTHTARRIWHEFDPSRWFSTSGDWQFDDPNPDCEHEFEENGSTARCALCGTRYQLHSESQFPTYADARDQWNRLGNVTYVNGSEPAFEPWGAPHVHRWRSSRRGEQTTISKCTKCRARKVSTHSETMIDYNSSTINQIETPSMEHCDHEWRRTGSGEECWKCGKPKDRSRRDLY